MVASRAASQITSACVPHAAKPLTGVLANWRKYWCMAGEHSATSWESTLARSCDAVLQQPMGGPSPKSSSSKSLGLALQSLPVVTVLLDKVADLWTVRPTLLAESSSANTRLRSPPPPLLCRLPCLAPPFSCQ